MDIKEFNRYMEQKYKEMDDFMRSKAPVLAGNIAKRHIQDDFRKGGFTCNGFRKWKDTGRQKTGGSSASSSYGPLLSGRRYLMDSIEYVPADYQVTVYARAPYAPIHNWGGTTHPTVTPKMRKYAWAMHYKEAGEDKDKDTMWKRLALTKKQKLDVTIPQRQFVSPKPGPELEKKVWTKIDNELETIILK